MLFPGRPDELLNDAVPLRTWKLVLTHERKPVVPLVVVEHTMIVCEPGRTTFPAPSFSGT